MIMAFYEVTAYNMADKRPSEIMGTVPSPTYEKARNTFLQNVGTCLPNYTTSHPKKTVIIGG